MADLQEVERLQNKMHRIRRHLDAEVDRLHADAAQIMDWKYYLSRYPLAAVALASAAGYLLVPVSASAPEKKLFLDPEVSRELAAQLTGSQGNGEFAVAQEAPRQGMVSVLGAVALNALVKVGLNYVSQQLRENWKQEILGSSTPRTGSPP